MKGFEHLVLHYLKSATNSLLDPFQFAYIASTSVEDAVSLGLPHILEHLDSPNTYTHIVFIDYSSAFNTTIPVKLFNKLRQLSINSQMCQWILSVLLDRPQVVTVNTLLSTSSWTDLRWSRSTPFCHSP